MIKYKRHKGHYKILFLVFRFLTWGSHQAGRESQGFPHVLDPRAGVWVKPWVSMLEWCAGGLGWGAHMLIGVDRGLIRERGKEMWGREDC